MYIYIQFKVKDILKQLCSKEIKKGKENFAYKKFKEYNKRKID